MSDIERRILNGTIAHYRSATGKLHGYLPDALHEFGYINEFQGRTLTAAEHFARLMDYSDRIDEQIAWRKFRGVNT